MYKISINFATHELVILADLDFEWCKHSFLHNEYPKVFLGLIDDLVDIDPSFGKSYVDIHGNIDIRLRRHDGRDSDIETISQITNMAEDHSYIRELFSIDRDGLWGDRDELGLDYLNIKSSNYFGHVSINVRCKMSGISSFASNKYGGSTVERNGMFDYS